MSSPRTRRPRPTEEARRHESDREDDQADLAGSKANAGHPAALGEAETLGPGPGVADHEGRGHGERGQQGQPRPVGSADDDPDVHDRFSPSIEHGIHERAEPGDLARRPSEAPVEQVERPAQEHHQPGGEPGIRGGQDGADHRDPEAEHRQAVRRQTEAPEEQGHRLGQLLDPAAGPGAHQRAATDPSAAHPVGSSVTGWDERGRTRPRSIRSRTRASSNASGRRLHSVSRPLRRVVTIPDARSLPRCQLTSGWERPTCSISSVTLAAPVDRRCTIRSRLTSARARWNRRI